MNLDDFRLVLVTMCICAVFVICIPVIIAYLPKGGEQFFSLAVLGEEGMAEGYFPGDDINIEVGEEVRWQIYLYNHMGNARYMSVRFKLLNTTMQPPNSTSCIASMAPMIFETRRIIEDNETLIMPFRWKLLEVKRTSSATRIEELLVNDNLVKTYVEGIGERTFRIVIELWIYEEETGDIIFGWRSGRETKCAWNQIWFNATAKS